jgi:hypothetical protein
VDSYYAKAYMTERLQEAENRRLIALSRRQPDEPSPLTRLVERWLGRSSQPIGVATTALATTGRAMEADCCAA